MCYNDIYLPEFRQKVLDTSKTLSQLTYNGLVKVRTIEDLINIKSMETTVLRCCFRLMFGRETRTHSCNLAFVWFPILTIACQHRASVVQSFTVSSTSSRYYLSEPFILYCIKSFLSFYLRTRRVDLGFKKRRSTYQKYRQNKGKRHSRKSAVYIFYLRNILNHLLYGWKRENDIHQWSIPITIEKSDDKLGQLVNVTDC